MKPFWGTFKLILAKIFWNEIFFSDKISMLKPPLCLIIVHLEGSFYEKSSAVGINGLLDSVEFPWYLCSSRAKLKIGDLTLIVPGAAPKVEKTGLNVWFLSTGWSKIVPCSLESRQKLKEMCDFCLPGSPKSRFAVSKVDKNRRKCVIFVYRLVQNRSAQSRK